LYDQTLWLSHERCIFWEAQQLLLLADLHLGKSGHFRKAGIGVPQQVFKEDMQRLTALIQFFKPRQLLVVGDLFHSHGNKEHTYFEQWRNDFAKLAIHLVKGNHDILHDQFYTGAGIQLHGTELVLDGFRFVHEPPETDAPHYYTFSGHLHPGVLLNGTGKQSLRLPCFYFGQRQAVLPAFGKFTGTYLVTPKPNDTIVAIAGNRLVTLG
jgi:uncharacterized protein